MKAIDIHNINRLYGLFGKGTDIVLVAHIHPDGDAIGSTLAMRAYLETLGCNATVIYPEPVPVTLSFVADGVPEDKILAYSGQPERAQEIISGASVIFCVDCNSFRRTGDMEACLRSASAFKVLIDHHLSPETEAFDLVFSETEVSSACELLYYIMLAMPGIDGKPESLPAFSAKSLMVGMTTDTNNFANSVYPSTFRMASGLLDAGVDRNAVLSELYNMYRENRLRLQGYLLYENMKITPEGIAYMIVNNHLIRRFGIQEGETEGFANMPLAIGNVKMSIFLKEDGEGFFRVSVRSKKGWSANKCATLYFHGGGHENASGGRLFFADVPGYKADIATPDDAAEYVSRLSKELFN